jgi:hypothetical protein
MKFIDSAVPNEQIWASFFHPDEILKKIAVDKEIDNFLNIGC